MFTIQPALSYLVSQQRVAEIGGSLTALCYLYQQAGWLVEGEQDFARIVDRLREGAPSRGRTLALSRALTGLAWWRHCRDQHEPAIQLLDECLSLLAGAQSPRVDQGFARLYRGCARRALGDHAGSRRDFVRAEADFTAEAWSYGLWLTEIYTAELDADEGLHDQAAAPCTLALATAERSELITAQIEALTHLGVIEIRLDENNRARLHLLRAARLCRNHQVVHPMAALLVSAALLLEHCGHTGSAASFARRAATRPDANFAVRRTAHELIKTTPAVPDEPLPGIDGSTRARYTLELDGRDDLAQLCELLDGLDVDAVARPVLTHRERQVLELLARGASNLQIAHRLDVAEGTVKGYTHHLFAKLGVQNRAEAVYESTQRNLL